MRVAILAENELASRLQTVIHGWGAETVTVDNTSRLAAELSANASDGTLVGAVVVERSALPDDPVAFLHRLREGTRLAAPPVILVKTPACASWWRKTTRSTSG